MEQEKSFNEKEYLMFRIKDKYCSNTKFSKWTAIISVVLAVLITVVTLFSGSFLRECNNVLLFLLLATSSYLSMKFGSQIEPINEPRELISEYDRYNRRSWWVFTPFIVAYLLSIVLLKEDLVMAAIVAGLTVVLIVVLWLVGALKDGDIARLRELVNQDNNEKLKDLATF